MKSKMTKIIAALLCLAMMFSLNVVAFADSKWDGYTAITDAAGLKAIESDLAGKYYLANDIVMPESWESIGWLADADVPFTGILDGNSKTVSGLKMNYNSASTYVGLFAINAGTITNLTISGAQVKGGTGVGAVAGVNKGTIAFCTVKDSDVIGVAKNYSTTLRIGGIAGQNGTTGVISDCIVDNVYVTGNRMVGGVAGSNLGTVAKCNVTDIKINSRKAIADIYKNGAANWINYNQMVWSYVGGAVGNNQGVVSECYVLGDIALYGFEYVGGIIGFNSATVTKIWMGAETHDIPYYNPYVYGSYSFYAEHVKLDIGYNDPTGPLNVEDVYVNTDGNHTAHTFGEWAIVTIATCTEDGLRSRVCELCGYVDNDVIPAAHTPGEWEVVSAPSCTETGKEELHCIVCGELLDSAEIIATGHIPGEWTVVSLPDCTTQGLKELHCLVCGELLDSEITDALGHTAGEWTVVTAPTCTAAGSNAKYCTVCGAVLETESIASLGHTAGGWTVVTPASCKEDGLKELYCTVCGELMDSEVIEATGHVDADNDGICDDCGKLIKKSFTGLWDYLINLLVKFFIRLFPVLDGVC